MGDFFKGLAIDLYQRVVLGWRSTLLGFALVLGVETANYLQAQPQAWVHAIGVALVVVFGALKPKAKPVLVPPAATLLFAFLFLGTACGTAGAVNGTFPLPTVDGVSCSATLQTVTVNPPPAECVKTITTQCVGPNASSASSTVNVNIQHGNPPACP